METKFLLAKKIVKFRERIDDIKEEKKRLEKDLKSINDKLVNLMDANGETSFTNKDGTFYQSTNFFVQIIDREVVYDWMKKHKFFSKLARVEINTNTLKSWIKERRETNSIIPTEGLNSYFETSVRFKKKGGKK